MYAFDGSMYATDGSIHDIWRSMYGQLLAFIRLGERNVDGSMHGKSVNRNGLMYGFVKSLTGVRYTAVLSFPTDRCTAILAKPVGGGPHNQICQGADRSTAILSVQRRSPVPDVRVPSVRRCPPDHMQDRTALAGFESKVVVRQRVGLRALDNILHLPAELGGR